MSGYADTPDQLSDCALVYSAGFRTGKANLGKFSAPPPQVEAEADLHAAWWRGWRDGSLEAAEGWSERVLNRFFAIRGIQAPGE
jgi:hypothetical protein